MIEFQRLLLGDTLRNDAFAKALKTVIVPGKTTIADIGSGTGYLSFVAEKLGAKECSLYEVSPDLLKLSKALAKKNDIKHCKFFGTHSTAVKHPPKVDIVVSETLGNWAYEENIIETMNDARRFLKPGGVMIPQELRAYVAPVTSSRLYDELNVWEQAGHGLDFAKAKEVCMNNMYVKDILPGDLLPSPAHGGGAGGGGLWDTVDFHKKNSSIREKAMTWKVGKDLTLYGFACWWDATLIGNVMISTSPFKPTTHWKQIYLPTLNPLPVARGQKISLSLMSDSRYEVKINVLWETVVIDQKGKTLKKMKQDMRKGFLQ